MANLNSGWCPGRPPVSTFHCLPVHFVSPRMEGQGWGWDPLLKGQASPANLEETRFYSLHGTQQPAQSLQWQHCWLWDGGSGGIWCRWPLKGKSDWDEDQWLFYCPGSRLQPGTWGGRPAQWLGQDQASQDCLHGLCEPLHPPPQDNLELGSQPNVQTQTAQHRITLGNAVRVIWCLLTTKNKCVTTTCTRSGYIFLVTLFTGTGDI